MNYRDAARAGLSCMESRSSALSFFPFRLAAEITLGQAPEGMLFRCFHFATVQ